MDCGDLRAYYARRAVEYEAIYAQPERQADLRTLEAALPACFSGRSVLEVACGTGWWTPQGEFDAAGNTAQQRRLADGWVHEVLKSDPAPAEAATALGPRARAVRWTALQHDWMLTYELATDELA